MVDEAAAEGEVVEVEKVVEVALETVVGTHANVCEALEDAEFELPVEVGVLGYAVTLRMEMSCGTMSAM